MTMHLSKRIRATRPSGTVALAQKARELSAAGRSIIDLAEGESDFDTPAHVVEHAAQAMRDGATRYTAVAGTDELLDAIINKFERDNGLRYTTAQVMSASGAKQIIFNAFQCTLDAGDEVIIPAPYWVSYPDITRFCGGVPRIVNCRAAGDFKLEAASLHSAIGKRTRWLVLNSPNNPSGSVYSREELESLAAVLRLHPQVLILCDDIYEHLVYTGEFRTLAQVAPDLSERVLTVNGVSKAYAMTGWRIGFAGGPAELISAMSVLQGQSTTNPCAVAQAAACAALDGPQDVLTERLEVFRERRDALLARLAGIDALEVMSPAGAFYLFIGCQRLLGRQHSRIGILRNDEDVAELLLAEAGAAVVPGTCFGTSPYLRVCFAKPADILLEVAERIEAAVGTLT